jgi:hypothetical protein
MSTRTALVKTDRAQPPKSIAAETQLNAAAPDILAELAAPCVEKGASTLQRFEKFAKRDTGVTLTDVKRLAAFLLAALEDPICPRPGAGIERFNRDESIQRLRDIAQATEDSLARYYITGNFATAPTTASASNPILCAELTAGIPAPAQTLSRYVQKKILDAGVLSALEQEVTRLTTIVNEAHIPTNFTAEKRAQKEHLLDPVKQNLLKIGEKLQVLVPWMPNYSELHRRINSRLPEVLTRLDSYHLPTAIEALEALTRDLNEAQRVIADKLKKST